MLAAGRSCLLPQVHPVHVMLLAVMYPTSIQHLPLVAQASLQRCCVCVVRPPQ